MPLSAPSSITAGNRRHSLPSMGHSRHSKEADVDRTGPIRGAALPRPCRAAASPAAVRCRGGGAPHLRPSLRRVRAHGAGVRDRRHPHALHGETARLVFFRSRLAGTQRRLPRGRAGPVRCRGDARAGCRRLRGARRRHHRHHLLDRHRHAQPRGARCRPHGLPVRRRARAGVRTGLRRRHLRPGDRRSPGAGAAGLDRAPGGDRDLHRGLPHGPAHQRQHGGDRAVRRWRCGLRRAHRRGGSRAHRRCGRASVARQPRHHGLEGRSDRAWA